MLWKLSQWLTSQRRVALLAATGTLLCIAIAFLIDSYSITEARWSWGTDPWKNVVIPGVIAPPAFYILLTMLRQVSIAHHRLELVASTDHLTSCLSRAAFATLVDAYLEKFSPSPALQGAMLIIDVDHFKAVNDNFGHDAGDEALKEIASSIKGVLRDVDLLGRLGGEEFSVFLPGARPDRCSEIAERIRAAVERIEFAPQLGHWPLSVSIGGTTFVDITTFSQLCRSADRRLYEAKRGGRNRVVITTHLEPHLPSLQ